MHLRVLALSGDGIGPEVMAAGLRVLDVVSADARIKVTVDEGPIHGAAWDQFGTFLTSTTLDKAKEADAILVGAVGGPKWDHIEVEGGPEEQDGLMKLRRELDVFACLRPARAWPGHRCE